MKTSVTGSSTVGYFKNLTCANEVVWNLQPCLKQLLIVPS